jgi:hypothetical protein
MPSARSASWLNQDLSSVARHFPGLGILPHIMKTRLISGAILAKDTRLLTKTSKRALNDLD